MKTNFYKFYVVLILLVGFLSHDARGQNIFTAQSGEHLLSYRVNSDNTSVTLLGLADGGTGSGSLIMPENVTDNGTEYSVTIIADSAFFNCTGLTGDLIIPNSVITIGERSFEFTGFSGNLAIGNSVTTIGFEAFYSANQFTSGLTIPNSVTNIGAAAFDHMKFAGDLVIGNSVTTIGLRAFENCTGFTRIISLSESSPTAQSNSFQGIVTSIPVAVPTQAAVTAYQAATGWSGFTNIILFYNLPFIEDFEGGMGIFANADGNNQDWVLETNLKTSGAYSIKNVHDADADNAVLFQCQMELPAGSNPILEFKHIAKTEGDFDHCYVEVSADAGTTWTILPTSAYMGEGVYTQNDHNEPAGPSFDEDAYSQWGTSDQTPTNDWWKQEKFTLADYVGQNIMLRFRLYSDGSGNRAGWLIDDVKIFELACPWPGDLVASGVTSSTAELSWTVGADETAWQIVYGEAGTVNLATATPEDITENPFTITGLLPTTDYEVYVRANCGTEFSFWSEIFEFTTDCAVEMPDYTEDFATYPTDDCWTEAQGLLTETVNMTGTSSDWINDDFANNGTSSSARMNVYGTGKDEWLITPVIDLGDGSTGYMLQFDLALTDYNSTAAAGTSGTDDKFAVVISTDAGATWSSLNTLRLWDNAGSAYVYNNIATTGEQVNIDLAGYTGNVKIGFYAESTITNADNDVYIDNVEVKALPGCMFPTALTADNITLTSASLSWTDDVNTEWELIYGPSGFDMNAGEGTLISDLTATTYELTGLTSSTSYQVYVRAICSETSVSEWTSAVGFMTECGIIATFPWLEEFTDWSIITSCWDLTGGSRQVSHYNGNSVEASLYHWQSGDDAYLTTPTIDITDLPDPVVEFYWAHKYTSAYSEDALTLQITADDGATWVDLLHLEGQTDFNSPGAGNFSPGTYLSSGLLDLSAYTGEIKLRFHFYSDYGPYAFIDNITIFSAPCVAPPDVAITNITAYGADVAWNDFSQDYALWNIKYGPTGFDVETEGTLLSDITAQPYTLLNLTADTEYDVYVQVNCGVDGLSPWSAPVNFTTDVSCPSPTGLAVANITSSTAELSWTAGDDETQWQIVYGEAGTVNLATATPEDITENTFTITGLLPTTDYEVYVQANCGIDLGNSQWTQFEFTTACATYTPDFLEDFATYLPNCWTEAQGLLTETVNMTGTISDWISDGFANNGYTGAAKINVYSTGRDEWLITPPINLGDGSTNYMLQFDLALTDYNSTAAAETSGTDDKFAVVISTDAGATWSSLNTLRLWDNAGSAYVYNDIATAGEQVRIDLSEYTGNVKIAFYAESTVSNADNDLFVDNVSVLESVLPSSETDILTYTFGASDNIPAVIDATAKTVNVEVVNGTNLTNLVAEFTLSEGATAAITGATQESGITANDFTSSVVYTVTAEDGVTTADWTVTATIEALSTATNILDYSFGASDNAPAEIDGTAKTVEIEVVFGTDVTNLVADFMLSADATATVGGVAQISGQTANDFTNPVVYTVTAEDGVTTADWTVTVSVAAEVLNDETDILTYGFGALNNAPAVINAANKTVNVELVLGTDVTSLMADFTLSADATATVGGVAQISGQTVNDFTNPVVYTVTAEDGVTTANWTVTVTVVTEPLNTETDILTYGFGVLDNAPATIDVDARTVTLEVVEGTDLTNLMAEFTLSEGAMAEVLGTEQESGVTANDFSEPVVYVVTAEDGVTTANWIVVVSVYTNIELNELSSISVYPNPNNGRFSVNFENVNEEVTYQLFDSKSSLVIEKTVNAISGYQEEINLNVEPGIYYLRIIGEKTTHVERLVIK